MWALTGEESRQAETASSAAPHEAAIRPVYAGGSRSACGVSGNAGKADIVGAAAGASAAAGPTADACRSGNGAARGSIGAQRRVLARGGPGSRNRELCVRA
ncbi:hypothetical protein GCM10020370_01890 [Paenibacillus hodogayensis]